MGETRSMNLKVRNGYKILVRKLGGTRPLWGPKHRWEDDIKMDLK
jgi:hypothetical protein